MHIYVYFNTLRLNKKHVIANINRKINDFKIQLLHLKKKSSRKNVL